MSKKRNNSNSSKSASKKKGQAPSSSLRKKPQGLAIGEYSIDVLNTFADFDCFSGIVLRTCGLFVVLAIMIQIRYAKNNTPPSMVDRLPSYRFYKARYLKSINCHAIVILLGMYQVLTFLPSDTETLESSLYSNLDAGVGSNTPLIHDKPNLNNWGLFQYGVISRILGLLNSCPATNSGIFNFPSSVREHKVENILKLLPFSEDVMPFVEDVKDFLRGEMLLEAENPCFEEEVLPGESGLTVLEAEIFGDVMTRRMAVSNTLSRGSLLPGNAVTLENIKASLSRIEFAQYELAVKTNPARLRELTALAVERFNAKKAAAAREQAAVSGTETDQAAVPNEDISKASPSAAVLRGHAASRLGRPRGSKNKEKPNSPSGSPAASSPAASRKGSPKVEKVLEPDRQLLKPPLGSEPPPGEAQEKKPEDATLTGVPISSIEPQPDPFATETSGELGESSSPTEPGIGGKE